MNETRELELLRRLERVLERLLRTGRGREARAANTRWVEWRVRRAFRRTIGQ